jgi:hypothetical protein
MSTILSQIFPAYQQTLEQDAPPVVSDPMPGRPGTSARRFPLAVPTHACNALKPLVVFFAAALVCAGPTMAATGPTTEPIASAPLIDAVAVVAARGVDHNFLTLPKAIVSGPDWERSTFGAVSVSKGFGTLGSSSDTLANTPLESVLHGVEGVLVKHRGLQHQVEAGAAYTLTTPFLHLGPVATNIGGGIGLSHAFGTPSYEDGPREDPARRYHTQLLILVDMEWKLSTAKNWSLLMRVHHRSGAYGLIAPPKVGSNFLAIGLRYSL